MKTLWIAGLRILPLTVNPSQYLIKTECIGYSQGQGGQNVERNRSRSDYRIKFLASCALDAQNAQEQKIINSRKDHAQRKREGG